MNEVPSQLLRQCEAVVCGHVVGVHYDAVLSARGHTTVLTHGGGQVSGDNMTGGQSQDGHRLSGAKSVALLNERQWWSPATRSDPEDRQ